MKNRGIAVLMAALMLLPLVGCAAQSQTQEPTPTPTAKVTAAPTAETATPTPAPTPTPTPTIYDAYREIVTQREWKYGEAGVEQAGPDRDYGYMKGVAMIRLMDWDGDGTEELLLWENTLNNGMPGGAQIEIWTYRDGQAVSVYSGIGLAGGGPNGQSFTITTINGVRYLILGEIADGFDVKFYAMNGTQLTAVHTLKSIWENPSKALLDGSEIDAEEAWEYLDNDDTLCNASEYLTEAETILQQTRQTRTILGM